MTVWHARNDVDTEDRIKYSGDNLHCHFDPKRKSHWDWSRACRVRSRLLKAGQKTWSSVCWDRKDWGSAFLRNVDVYLCW